MFLFVYSVFLLLFYHIARRIKNDEDYLHITMSRVFSKVSEYCTHRTVSVYNTAHIQGGQLDARKSGVVWLHPVARSAYHSAEDKHRRI